MLICTFRSWDFSIHWYFIALTEKWFYRSEQLLYLSEGKGFITNNQPGRERKLLSIFSTSPSGKDSVCKCEGGFKQEHLSWSLTVSHVSKCPGKKPLEWNSWWRWQDVGTGWLHGGLCVKRPGLPHARYSCLQPAPMDTPHNRAEHLSQDGDTAKKMYLRKNVRTSSKNTKVSKKRGGRGVLGIRAQIPLQCMEKTSLEHMNITWRNYIFLESL